MSCFDQLLHPVPQETFFADYWGRKPLYVTGSADRFGELPDLGALPSVLFGRLSAEQWTSGHWMSAQASFFDREGVLHKLLAPPDMWNQLFNAGVSLCFGPMDHCSKALTDLVKTFAASTPYPGRIFITCYLTPAASGSGVHFDCQHVFFLQVSGKKHWKIGASPAWPNAMVNADSASLKKRSTRQLLDRIGLSIPLPEQTTFEDLTLAPGDVLYLPPGVWHDGSTTDSHSLHYTLTFAPLGPWQVLMPLLLKQVMTRSAWREDIRYPPRAGDQSREERVAEMMKELMAILEEATVEEVMNTYDDVMLRNLLTPFMI